MSDKPKRYIVTIDVQSADFYIDVYGDDDPDDVAAGVWQEMWETREINEVDDDE